MAKKNLVQLKIDKITAEMDRGRGAGSVCSKPIELEPPLSDFHQNETPRCGFWNLFKKPSPQSKLSRKKISVSSNLGFISIRPTKEEKFNVSLFERFLLSLQFDHPLSFEIIATANSLEFQLTAQKTDLPVITGIIQSQFPEIEASQQADFLLKATQNTKPVMALFGLEDSHFFPLASNHKLDPYAALLSNLNSITSGMAALQILFQPVKHNWADHMQQACRDEYEPTKSVFADLPELPKLVTNKVSKQLLAASVRIIASNKKILEQVAGFFNQYANEYNRFVRMPVKYPIESALNRTNHVPGIILSSEELVGLIHLPDSSISIPKLQKAKKSTPPPQLALVDGINLGSNAYQGIIKPVSISPDWLTRHMAVFGGTGTGKTNLFGHLFSQFIEKSGCAFLDPNGDASVEFLSLIPKDCIDRVIYFDPVNNPLSINPLSIKHPSQIELTTVNLLTALKRLFDSSSWGPRLEYILRKSIKTLVITGNKTLLDIPLLLTDKNYRAPIISGISDPDLLNFWKNSFPKLGLSALLPILNKLSVLLDSDIIKPIISNPQPDIDFSDILNNQKIFICNLSKGILGEKNAHILGSFIQSAFQMEIMARASIPINKRKPFILMIDEFHNYADSANVDSINSLLSEARKYKVSLLTATQFLSQVDRRIKDAIFGNVGTLICLRIGIDDAQVLQKELGQYGAEDLLNLQVGEAIVRMGVAKDSFNLQIPLLQKPSHDHSKEILKIAKQKKTAVVPITYSTPGSSSISPYQVPHASSTQTNPIQTTKSSGLTSEERSFLHFLYQTTDILPLSDIMQRLGYGGNKLYKVVNSLLGKGLIEEAKLSLAATGRKSRIVVITSNGISELGYPSPTGKGGALHQYFQKVIKAYAEKKGYKVTVEQQLSNQQSVDLSLEKANQKTAIEISITTDAAKEMSNIQKNLTAGYDRLIILCIDNQTAENLKKRVKQSITQELQAKIFIPSLTGLFQII